MKDDTVINKKIAIIGGGPGGLTLARLLQMNGANVTVYERDEHRNIRVQGATLDLHYDSGLKALKQAGLMQDFIANYRPGAEKIRITDNKANIVYDEHTMLNNKHNFEDVYFRPEIDRGPLRDILLNSLKPETVQWNRYIVSLEPIKNAWKIIFQDGSFANADIVIGADGANSKIRAFITSIKPFYCGVTAMEGAVYDSEKNAPAIHALLKGGKIFAFGDNKSLIVSSKGDGSLAFYTGSKTDEFWARNSGIDFNDKTQSLNWFKKTFINWSNIWHELFNNAAYFIARPQYCMPLDQTWQSQPNITMLGDAAHVMPPYAGEGVNMAMQDALELSECLLNENFGDTKTAIAAYENKMRMRASAIAKETLEQTEILHSLKALSYMQQLFEQVAD